MQMTITLPDRIGAALNKAASEFDLDGPTYLKQLLFAAATSAQGVTVKLDLPPVPQREASELPLFSSGEAESA
jgi:hypothetical protein